MDPRPGRLGPLPPESRRRGGGGPAPLTEQPVRALELIPLLDLTSLTGREDDDSIRELCARARAPLPDTGITAAAVCVHVPFVPSAVDLLVGSGVRVATVAGDFPLGRSPLEAKVEEIRAALAAGAGEVDAVVDRRPILGDDFRSLGREVEAFREATGGATLKVILGTGELGSARRVARAALTTLEAGADFLKTSTGFDEVNATLEAGRAMAGAIRDFRDRSGGERGLKAAGGIRTMDQALEWRELVIRELGHGWLNPDRFRIGASGLLDDLLRAHAAEADRAPKGRI